MYGMPCVAGVSGCPAPRGTFRKKLLAVGTLLAPNDPRGDVIWEMPSMPFVIERELFDGAVPRLYVVQFVIKLPVATTPGT